MSFGFVYASTTHRFNRSKMPELENRRKVCRKIPNAYSSRANYHSIIRSDISSRANYRSKMFFLVLQLRFKSWGSCFFQSIIPPVYLTSGTAHVFMAHIRFPPFTVYYYYYWFLCTTTLSGRYSEGPGEGGGGSVSLTF